MKNLMAKYLFSCFILLSVNNNVYATEQSMDVLIYNDSVSFLFSSLVTASHPIQGYPLEYFIWSNYDDTASWKVKEEMMKPYRWCMRGYIAGWEIRNDSLFLMKISYAPTVTAYVESKPADSFPLQRLFPERDVANGVFADWFSGRFFTVMYEKGYPPLEDDYWKNKRKTFVIINGKLVGVKRW